MPQLLGEKAVDIWRKLLGLRLLLSTFLILVAIVTAVFMPEEILFKRLIFIGVLGAVLGQAVFVTANAIFQAKLRYDLSVIVSAIYSVTTLLAVYIISATYPTLEALMFGYLIGWALMLLASLLLVKKFISQLAPLFDFEFIKKTFLHAWPISLTLLLNVIYFRIDTFLLSYFKTLSDVGIYNLSFSLFQAGLVLPTFIMNGYYPLMIKSFENNKAVFRKQLLNSSLLMLGLGLLGTGITIFFGQFFIDLITGGQGFVGSNAALQLLGLSFPVFFVSSLLMWVLVTLKKYKTMVVIYLVGLVFNVVLNIYFIPQYSYLATSAVTSLSEYLILLLQIIILFPILKGLK